ncbi:MAG: hypothetical protein NVS1B4_13070 [Gemmatimonadaceae bacterium]
MVDAMSAAERKGAAAAEPPHSSRAFFGTIVVVGGGCYGTYYVRQLRRAADAGRIGWRRLVVVDRNADCAVAQESTSGAPEAVTRPADLIVDDWRAYFGRYLSAAATAPASTVHDAIVPSPLMPHLIFDWLRDRATARWPARAVSFGTLDARPPVPWHRLGSDGTDYVSHATWMCPVNCIEPARCPHTRGDRNWSLPETIQRYADDERQRGVTLAGPAILHCTHRSYGVGMFDTADVLAADAVVDRAGTDRPTRVLIGTMSHCHGALGVLVVD